MKRKKPILYGILVALAFVVPIALIIFLTKLAQ